MEFFKENIPWIFSGIGVAILVAVIGFFRKGKEPQSNPKENSQNQNITGNQNYQAQSGHDTVINVTHVEKDKAVMEAGKIKSDLLFMVHKIQRKHVRESYGESAHECFTADNLEEFNQNNILEKVCESLSTDTVFLELVGKWQELSLQERKSIISEIRKTYKPTWEQLGGISSDGQTDAGQSAERQIAGVIADLVEKHVGS